MSEFYGLTEEAILERIESGATLTSLAAEVGKNRSLLTRWLAADEQRSARSVRARQLGAGAHEEAAEAELRAAADAFELSRAKELAHHLRWRASKLSPKEWGDKLDLDVKGTMSVKLDTGDGGVL